MTAIELTSDPLLFVIEAFRKGMSAYDEHPGAGTDDDDAVGEQTYLPALRALERWKAPAVTRAGAMAALELANEDLEHSMDHALVSAMVKAACEFFRDEAVSTAGPDLTAIFTASVAAVDRHSRMEALYDALAHLSDCLSGLVSRPRMGEEGPGAEALETLDDFVMDQMDSVKNRALAVPPADWADRDARIALLMKHVARFRTDTDEMLAILPLITADLAAVQSDA